MNTLGSSHKRCTGNAQGIKHLDSLRNDCVTCVQATFSGIFCEQCFLATLLLHSVVRKEGVQATTCQLG